MFCPVRTTATLCHIDTSCICTSTGVLGNVIKTKCGENGCLFDLNQDPQEQNNLARSACAADVYARLRVCHFLGALALFFFSTASAHVGFLYLSSCSYSARICVQASSSLPCARVCVHVFVCLGGLAYILLRTGTGQRCGSDSIPMLQSVLWDSRREETRRESSANGNGSPVWWILGPVRGAGPCMFASWAQSMEAYH